MSLLSNVQHGAGVLAAAPLVYVGNVISRTLVIHVCRAKVPRTHHHHSSLCRPLSTTRDRLLLHHHSSLHTQRHRDLFSAQEIWMVGYLFRQYFEEGFEKFRLVLKRHFLCFCKNNSGPKE